MNAFIFLLDFHPLSFIKDLHGDKRAVYTFIFHSSGYFYTCSCRWLKGDFKCHLYATPTLLQECNRGRIANIGKSFRVFTKNYLPGYSPFVVVGLVVVNAPIHPPHSSIEQCDRQ